MPPNCPTPDFISAYVSCKPYDDLTRSNDSLPFCGQDPTCQNIHSRRAAYPLFEPPKRCKALPNLQVLTRDGNMIVFETADRTYGIPGHFTIHILPREGLGGLLKGNPNCQGCNTEDRCRTGSSSPAFSWRRPISRTYSSRSAIELSPAGDVGH